MLADSQHSGSLWNADMILPKPAPMDSVRPQILTRSVN